MSHPHVGSFLPVFHGSWALLKPLENPSGGAALTSGPLCWQHGRRDVGVSGHSSRQVLCRGVSCRVSVLHCGTSPAAGFLPPAGPKNRVSTVLLRNTGESQRRSRRGAVSVAASRQVSPRIGAGLLACWWVLFQREEKQEPNSSLSQV